MSSWKLIWIYILVKNCDASNEAHYECGPHGRFEYCIDGIPGCVIGCHCYPGYYFDTESKICEPNIKLTQDYRRHYSLEPTRLPIAMRASEPEELKASTKKPVDVQVDAIAKEADDLGDWLYNQFFKTIENQVINKTDSTSKTRRSGAVQPMPRRRAHKKTRRKLKKKGKKYKKKKGFKQKLLRITEDDSLFDSSSNSEDTSDDDDDGSESMSDSDTSSDSGDKNHDHRKILMMNKKPKGPLPSFIFLPNMDTPFYPPIGLPAPPLPMYPLVPIPPMPFLGYTPLPSSSTTGAAPAPGVTEAPKPDAATTTPSGAPPATTAAPVATEPPPATEAPPPATTEPPKSLRNRKKKMMRLQNKLRKKNRGPMMPQMAPYVDNFQDPETPYFSEQDGGLPAELRAKPMYDEMPPLSDVGFKYLSQLIHKVDMNNTKPAKKNSMLLDLPNFNPSMPMRRAEQMQIPPEYFQQYQSPPRPEHQAEDTNEAFYSNLGKQIASLIRKVDADGQQIDIEISPPSNRQNQMDTMLNENRFAPRSYWERFVRSPSKSKQAYTYGGELVNFQHSSENLFNLEDQVSIAAAVERSLSLQELENIANVMQKQQPKVRKVQTPPFKLTPGKQTNAPAHSGSRFDINLLPSFKMSDTGPRVKEITVKQNKNIKDTLDRNIVIPKQYHSHKKRVSKITTKYIHNATHPQSLAVPSNFSRQQEFLASLLKSALVTPLQHEVSRVVHKNYTSSTQHFVKYQVNPMVVKFKNLNFASNSRKPYREHSLRSPIPIYTQHTSKSVGKPSLFHHEFHHFDFFE